MQKEQSATINLIDVGAAGDLPDPWDKRRNLIGNILRFEPRERARQADNVISLAAMLWDKEEERNFYIYRGFNGSGSSLFLQNYEYVLQHYETLKKRGRPQLAQTWLERSLLVDVQRVQCRTLDSVLRELNLPFTYHFLKIDAQGAEYNILKGAEHYLKNDCYGLHLELFELPLYKDIKLFAEVAAYLEALGFELAKKYPAHGTFDSQHDCLFLKRGKDDPVMTAIRNAYDLPTARSQINRQSFVSHVPRLSGDIQEVLRISRERLEAFKNIHAGRRCVIIGNGPSLNNMDLSFLEHEICFGMNKIFLLFDRWQFRPTYYVAVNPLVIEQSTKEILNLSCPKFLSHRGIRFFEDPRDIIFIKSHDRWVFTTDPRNGLHEGWTVTYVALQLAYFMGFSEVVLIGVDHHFVATGKPNEEVVSQGDDPNHFHPDYFGKGKRWHLPDLERSERSYRMAKEAFEADGRRIIDATLGGKLNVFPKADYREVFGISRRSVALSSSSIGGTEGGSASELFESVPEISSVSAPTVAPVQPPVTVLPVNQQFLERQREFWNVQSMYEAMFERVYVDPALKTLPLEQKIERWNKSAEISVGRVLSGIPSRPEWKVLEIGCGVGRLIKPLRERFAEVDGVDISENMIAFAHQYLADAKQNGRVMVNSGSDLKMFPDASYDFVFSMIVFQHIRSVSVVRSYFREICRVLKPGGYFKIQVHRAGSRGYGKADDEAEPEKQYGFFGNGYTAEDLNTLLEEAGLSVVELKPDGHWLWATAVKPARAGREHQYLVSAIVSTYNAERFIRGCLEDLVVQTLYQKGLLEIIVINSGSQENEETIVREFQMRHPHIVYFKTERETLYAAWNRGVQIARGKYLTTANTDDRHHPRAFERMAQALEDDPAIGLVYADSLVTRDENAAWGVARAKGVFRWPEFDLRLLYDICYMGPHPMWRASLHHEHGYFDESFVSAGDYEFWLRIASRGVRMRHIPETLGLYLERDTSVSLSNLDRTWKESERARSMHWPAAWGKKPATQWRSCEEPLQNAEALRQQRILICCDYFWPSVGGVEALVEDLGVRLRDKGYAVAFAVRHIPEREELVRHGITIHQFACNGDLYGGLTGDIQGYQQFLISSGFDRILVLSQPDNWVSLGLYQVREKISSKIIFLPSINRADIERWQRRGVQAEVEAVIRSADALVVVTEDGYDARYAAQNRIPAVYIPHSIDVVADPANFRTRHNLHPDKPLLAVVANFWPVKNHRELLRTLRTCNDDWQIVLIGNPVEAVKYCYEKACAEAARDSRVRILPGLPREQAAAAIRDADLLLVPSQAESAGPLVVLQAMQYGTPWIATPHCNGVYSEPGGVIAGIDKFPDVIRYLLGNPEIRRELGRQGKEGYAACFSWDKTLDAYVSLLENKSAVPDLKLPEALREQKWRLQDSVMQAVTGDLPAGRTLQEIQRLFPKRPVPGNKFGMIEVNGIKGFLEDKEMQQLYNRALNLRRGGMIIEIGSFMGLSASIMARALLESGNYNARIYCIDWWTAFKDRITPEYRPFYSVENFKANLFRTGIDRMVTVIDRKSPECAALFEDNCADMVFVDGDHSLQGCLNDLEAWYPKVKPGGVLIGHDYTWTESVRQAVHAFLDRHQLGSRFCAPDKGTSLFCIAKPPSETGDAPVFSVIIPTRNRSAVLEKCLAALAAQDFEPSKIEVIVCDDGSSDATEQVVQAFSAPWPLFYLRQERKGPAAARNLGIKTARGEYVLFLNDDAILDKHALAIHYQTHMARRGERIAVLGRFAIAAEYRQTPFGHLLDTTDILFNYAAKAADEYYNYNSFYTCNISLPRQAVIDAGMFDESFTAPAAEDIDLGYRLHQKGWRVFYKDTCIAFHDHKLKIADFCATHRMRGYWRVAMLYKYRDAGLKWLSDEDYRHIRTAVVGNAELEADIGQLVAKVEDEDRAGADAGTIKKKADELYPLVKKIQLYHEIQGYLSHPYYEVLFNPKYREAPLVSVVVPCYNHGAYLRECVESIVRQSFQNFEIIIVNDGSTDDSLGVARQLMREYPDHRIRILDQPHSGQPAIARNNGIAAALGKYILSLDADDWILPDALAGMVAAADARDGSEVVAYGYMQKFGVKNNVWPTGPCNRNILPRQNQLPNASLYRKSLWEKIGGYNQNVPGYEDWDFWIRASQAGAEFICLDRICIMYRTTESTSMLDRAAARHEHNVAHIIMNSPALYDPVEREWAANYLREFPEPPARQKPFDPNEAYAAVRASLIVHAFPGIYSEQEKAQAYRYLLQLANRRRRPVVTKTHDRRGNPIVAGRGNGTYKVLFVCHDFPPYRFAGAQLYAKNLAQHINATQDITVDVFHPVFSEAIDGEEIRQETYEGLVVYRLFKRPDLYNRESYYSPRVAELFDSFLKQHRYDLVHIHGLGQLSTAPIEIARHHDIPVFMTLHDYWFLCDQWHLIQPDQTICSGPASLEKCTQCFLRHHVPVERHAALHAAVHAYKKERASMLRHQFGLLNRIFAPSRYLRDTFAKYGFDNIEVQPLGLAIDTPLPKQPHSGIVFAYAGQIIRRKGVDTLITAFKQCRREHCALRLYGASYDQPYFDAIMQEIQGDPSIMYCGAYTPADLPLIMSGSDVMVIPSLMENYPLLVQEAFMHRVPVIASAAGGIPEAVRDGVNGFLFEPGNVSQLAVRLQKIIDAPELIDSLRSGIPSVKSIGEDANWYAAQYRRCIGSMPRHSIRKAALPNRQKILFYFFKNVHIPVMMPVYKKFKLRYPAADIAFGYMRHAPQIRAGFTRDELQFLKACGERMYAVPQEFSPDITFIADSVYPWVQGCGKLIHIGHGVLSKGQYYTDTATARREEQADIVCVPGRYHENIMRKIISRPVVATGMAKLDTVFSGELTRKTVISRYGLPEQYRYILFAPTFNDELSAIPFVEDRIVDVLPDDTTVLIIKLHGSTRQEYQTMYRRLVEKNPRVIFADELDITPFLALADVMISDVSSAMMEFAALDKPLVLFNNPQWTSYQNYNPSDIEFCWRDIGLQVQDLSQMREAVAESLADPMRLSSKRKWYTDQLFANKYDGRAAERIIDCALDTLGVTAEKGAA